MATPEWGTKQFCQACGAKFYDLQHDDAVCPKCSTPVEPAPTAKPRRAPAEEPAAASEATAPTAKLAVETSDDAPAETSDDEALKALGVDDDDSGDSEDNADLIEDASELGEDEDDMAEVVATSHGDETP